MGMVYSASLKGNGYFLDVLLIGFLDRYKSIINVKFKNIFLENAVMTDAPEVVATVLKFFNREEKYDSNLLELAQFRGNRDVILLLLEGRSKLNFLKDVAGDFFDICRSDRISGKHGIDVLPRAKDVDYCDKNSQVKALLDGGKTITVAFDELLKFHMNEVHYGGECGQYCLQKESCQNIRKTVRIAEYIKDQLGKQEKLFKFIKKPTVVGSLRENSRLFSLDEIDINLY